MAEARNRASDEELARLIGDASEAMGAYYTRYVEDEASIVPAFGQIKDKA